MDRNLKLRLYDVGYEVGPSCSTCMHQDFSGPGINGLCKLFKYQPASSITGGGEQHMTITRAGRCKFHQLGDEAELAVDAFLEFSAS